MSFPDQFAGHRTIADSIGSHLSLNLKIRVDRIQEITYAIAINSARSPRLLQRTLPKAAERGRAKYDMNQNMT
jgi:hypothetical protein